MRGYQKENQFIIELIDDVDEWNCPLLFSAYVKNDIYTISRDDADCIDKEDLIEYMQHNLKDTGETCETLECTRQNMAYYLSKGYIKPIKENVKGNMFLKGDILKLMW